MEDADYIRKVGEAIKKARKEQGITQMDLADACNFEKQNMQRLESGRTNPTIKTLLKIARALDIELIDLLKF